MALFRILVNSVISELGDPIATYFLRHFFDHPGMPHVHHLQVPAEPHFSGSIEAVWGWGPWGPSRASLAVCSAMPCFRTSGIDTKTTLPRWTGSRTFC